MLSPVSGLSAGPLIRSYPFQRPGRADLAGRANNQEPTQPSSPKAADTAVSPEGAGTASATGLTPKQEQIVAELAAIDRQVRAHEQAHLAAAGGLASGVSFIYTTGPDGKQYAVGGEVSIDTSAVSGDPAATIRKAQQIRAAANAPANPSGQDRAVAAQASQMEAAARQELAEQNRRELEARNRAVQTHAYGAHEAESAGGLLLSLIG